MGRGSQDATLEYNIEHNYLQVVQRGCNTPRNIDYLLERPPEQMVVTNLVNEIKERGFLPTEDPLTEFDTDRHPPEISSYLQRFDQLGSELPNLIESGEVRSALRSLDPPPDEIITRLDEREITRLCKLSAFFASAYVHYDHPDAEAVSTIPAGIAIPLYETSVSIGRKPILAYDLLCLHNFRRKDPDGELSPDNSDHIERFTHYDDERWFVIIHVAIEAAAEPAIAACTVAQQAVIDDDPTTLREALERIGDSLAEQARIMSRMTEGNDPEVFAHEFRPYYEGFDDVVYKGVEEFDGEPQSFRGGSGAQSSALPSIDATLGIEHELTKMVEKLGDMRSYMPPLHRSTIEELESGPDIVEYVTDHDTEELWNAYEECTAELERFRKIHFSQVIQYIREETGDEEGTGGTNYMKFLRKLQEETKSPRSNR